MEYFLHFSHFLSVLTCQHMGWAPQGHLEWPPAPLLILTSFELASLAMSRLEVFIRVTLALVQHWGLS